MMDLGRALCVLGVLVVVACGGASSRPVQPSTPVIVVIERGAEPRQKVRYELVRHAPEYVELDLKSLIVTTVINTVLETATTRRDQPTVRFTARHEVTEITPEGDARVKFQIDDVKVLEDVVVEPAVRPTLERQSAAAVGLRGWWRVSSRGAISEMNYETTDVPRGVRDRLDRMADVIRTGTAVFPDEEIGIGAKWEVTDRYASSGVSWNRKTTYSLSRLGDSVAGLDVEAVIVAPRQALSVEPNATTTLESGKSRSSGKLSVPLRGLAPTYAATSSAELRFKIVARKLRIMSTVVVDLVLSSRPGQSIQANP